MLIVVFKGRIEFVIDFFNLRLLDVVVIVIGRVVDDEVVEYVIVIGFVSLWKNLINGKFKIM